MRLRTSGSEAITARVDELLRTQAQRNQVVVKIFLSVGDLDELSPFLTNDRPLPGCAGRYKSIPVFPGSLGAGLSFEAVSLDALDGPFDP
jgi:hypothetical protein